MKMFIMKVSNLSETGKVQYLVTDAEFDKNSTNLSSSSTRKDNKVEVEWQESVQGSIPPVTLSPQEVLGEIKYGSYVEFIDKNKELVRGVVKWLGHIGDPQKIIVGIEMVGNA